MRSSPVSLTSGADVSRRTALIGLAAAPLLIGAAPIPPDPTVDCNAGRFAGNQLGRAGDQYAMMFILAKARPGEPAFFQPTPSRD